MIRSSTLRARMAREPQDAVTPRPDEDRLSLEIVTHLLTGVDPGSGVELENVDVVGDDSHSPLQGYARSGPMIYVTAAIAGNVLAAGGAWILARDGGPKIALIKAIAIEPVGEGFDLERQVIEAIEFEAELQGCERTYLTRDATRGAEPFRPFGGLPNTPGRGDRNP